MSTIFFHRIAQNLHEIPLFLRGISYERVFLNLLKVFCDPGNLILVLNSDDYEEKLYTKLLNSSHVHQASTNGNERLMISRNLILDFIMLNF